MLAVLSTGTEHIKFPLFSGCINNASACFLQRGGPVVATTMYYRSLSIHQAVHWRFANAHGSPGRVGVAAPGYRRGCRKLGARTVSPQQGAKTEQEPRPGSVPQPSSTPPPAHLLTPSLLGPCPPLPLPRWANNGAKTNSLSWEPHTGRWGHRADCS